jgi:hypothetical protein
MNFFQGIKHYSETLQHFELPSLCQKWTCMNVALLQLCHNPLLINKLYVINQMVYLSIPLNS